VSEKQTEGTKPTPPDASEEQKPKIEAIRFVEFLEKVAPSQFRPISDLWHRERGYSGYENKLTTPDVTLFCDHELCGGPREFRFVEGYAEFYNDKTQISTFLSYRCSNCQETFKRYSLLANRDEEPSGTCYKYGEEPAFGPPTPPRLIRLFGDDKDLFMKGRRCESQGLGIGAFVYYRRVVESHKDQIFDEIIRVSKTIGLQPDKLATIIDAKKEIQFTKALDAVKDALPQTLLIKGQNPLTLLHSALSGGLHGKSDSECLQLAQAIRLVLVELAEKMSAALNDERELSEAVARLMKSKSLRKADG